MKKIRDCAPGENIVIQNQHFKLVIGTDAVVKSLLHLPENEECLAADEEIALCSVTQERPYNNEIKLAHPNKKTAFQANRLRRDGDILIVGFELVPYDARIRVKETPWYVSFQLFDFQVHKGYESPLNMDYPPVSELRLLQLPIKNRENFGEWLNVSWDSKAAVCVLATSPYEVIDAQRRKDYRVMSADAVNSLKLQGAEAALIVCAADQLLDGIACLEEDYDLPRGVEARRSEMINASYYWASGATPKNIDEYIEYARMGGFRCMLLYYTCIFKEFDYTGYIGNYEYRDEYPNGRQDLIDMLGKIKAAGIIPGLHFLHTHIGLKSKYVTPVADHRLNLTRRYTLARPLGEQDTIVYVEQNPAGSAMADGCRVLKLGGELLSYEGYSTRWPYCFTGVKRGAYETKAGAYPQGLICGLLDVSEFGAQSVYLDQNSSLQDEIAEKIADAYQAGFEFVYFDGAEGVAAPFGFQVPNAQYQVYKRLQPAPLFAESAAKAHFSWHMLSGGNAFDIFPPEVFKEKIRQHPCEQIVRMKQDFTRINFGWWGYWTPGTQPDILEYGTSRAAAWDCPIGMYADVLHADHPICIDHPRTPDNFEVLRRWEDVRAKKWLTDEHKQMLRNLEQEHILLINENHEYELVPYNKIQGAVQDSEEISAFIFERNGACYVVYWHKWGEASIELPVSVENLALYDELDEKAITITETGGLTILPAGGRRYLKSYLSKEQLTDAFRKAKQI